MKNLKMLFILSGILAFAISFLSYSARFIDDAFGVTCYEYNNIVNDNIDCGENDFVLKSQFTKPESWKKCDDKLPLCQPGSYINRICIDNKLLPPEVDFQDILNALFTYLKRNEQILNHGSELVLTIKKKKITIRIFLRHKHES